MNTKLIMTLCAISLAVIGIGLTFLPSEIAVYTGLSSTQPFQVILQILGALYFAFAMLNWMAKDSVIGGIYNKPIAVANLTHFLIGALALIKVLMNNHGLPNLVYLFAGVYSIFAFFFGIIFFQHPVNKKN